MNNPRPQEVPAFQHFDENPQRCNEYTYHWEPDRIIIDFKAITPQFGPGGQPLHLMISHKTIALDPWLAKMLAVQMDSAVKEYEKRFGKIEQSKAQLKATKEAKRIQTATASQVEKPSYMG